MGDVHPDDDINFDSFVDSACSFSFRCVSLNGLFEALDNVKSKSVGFFLTFPILF